MAKTKISEYDATAANNTDIDSISIAEGMLPSNVNNALRELMAHLKDMDAGTQALTSPQLTSVDINGGTIDGAVIGGNSAAAISGTTSALSGNADLNGDLDVDGTTNLDVVDIDGAVDFASTTAHAGNATFADNAKAIFGYHNYKGDRTRLNNTVAGGKENIKQDHKSYSSIIGKECSNKFNDN